MDSSMQVLDIDEICYTENSGSESYCNAVNDKIKQGWSLFGPRTIDSGWIKQYYVKINKSKTKVKD